MRLMKYAAASSAAVMMSAGLLAQAPSQQGPTAAPSPAQLQRPAPASGSTAADQMVTVVGCIQKETDYRKATDAGKGGVVGTGIGAGNEFVLTSASIATPAASATSTATADFELTGSNEGQVAAHVGKRVEVMGKLKPAEVGAVGPTGGPTAGAPPRGVDVASKDLKLRELEVTSIKTASGSCTV